MLSLTHIDLVQRARNVRLLAGRRRCANRRQTVFLADGSEAKAFSTLDGQGIKMLMNSRVNCAIITGRTSASLKTVPKTLVLNMLSRAEKISASRSMSCSPPCSCLMIS